MGETSTGKAKTLIAQLTTEIEFYDRQSTKHKNLHRSLRYAIFGLTGLSTVLASLVAYDGIPRWVSIITVTVTATIGLLTSIEGMRKPAELWLHEKDIQHALEDLRCEVEYRSSGALSEADVDQFFCRMQEITSEGGSSKRVILRGSGAGAAQQSVPADGPASASLRQGRG